MYDNQQRAFIAVSSTQQICLNPAMANRHGLITGATGTGKTVSLQTLAETFSRMGVAVFAADVKGDLAGMAKPGGANSGVEERVRQFKLAEQGFAYQASPVQLWDVFGQQGAALRATVAEMGPLLLSRLLNLSDTQQAVLSVAFKIAQDEALELVDLKDLQKLLEYVQANSDKLAPQYGRMSAASIGAIQRGLVALAGDGADSFFGEPALNLRDIMLASGQQGVINILAADKLMASPAMYTTFLLWLINKLFAELPEVGDAAKPRLVFFFDEAHLLFSDAPKVLLQKVEQVVRLIRSKGVGIYFVSQSPADIPDSVLSQLGNRLQHALRAYTPKDLKALKAAAQSFRANPDFDTEQAISELGIGEALVSFLDDKGTPQPVQRAFVLPPEGQVGPLSQSERQQVLNGSTAYAFYAQAIDRTTAYELLSRKLASTLSPQEQARQQKAEQKVRQQEEKERKAVAKEQQREARERKRFWSGVAKSTLVPLARKFFGSLFK